MATILKAHRSFGRGRTRHVPGAMNRTEARYAEHLKGLRIVGQIEWYAFESIKFKMANNTHSIPDFAVMQAGGLIEFHDVKGTTNRLDSKGVKQSKPFIEDDAALKMKLMAELFPFVFKTVFFDKEQGWLEIEY